MVKLVWFVLNVSKLVCDFLFSSSVVVLRHARLQHYRFSFTVLSLCCAASYYTYTYTKKIILFCNTIICATLGCVAVAWVTLLGLGFDVLGPYQN